MTTKKTNLTATLIVLVTGALILAVLYRVRFSGVRHCDDGDRYSIDLTDFETRYSGYSADFSVSLEKQGQLRGKVAPLQLQQLSESVQQSNEFRKAVVAGYNSCAITKSQYADFISRYQSLDSLARRIDSIASKAPQEGVDRKELDSLVDEYIKIAGRLNLP